MGAQTGQAQQGASPMGQAKKDQPAGTGRQTVRHATNNSLKYYYVVNPG